MAEKSIPWLKQFQSIGRGFRPGMQVGVVSAGRNVGKTRMHVDIESDDFKPWREMMRPHLVEYIDFDTGERHWKRFTRQPKMSEMYVACNVVRKNEDGSYEYVKNRETGELRQLTDKEVMWLLLKVGG